MENTKQENRTNTETFNSRKLSIIKVKIGNTC